MPLRIGETTFGRQQGCDVRVPSAAVSRRHCTITVTDDAISIEDLGSSNGTYVNRSRVEETELHPGDLLSIGGMVLMVQIDGEPSDFEAAEMHRRGVPDTSDTSALMAQDSTKPATAEEREDLADELEKLAVEDNELDDSSVFDFDFDVEDEEDDQPPL